jgi:hypothetical protein
MGCKITKILSAVLLFVVTIAALIGVYETHIISGSEVAGTMLQFGSTSGSLAIIAFAIALTTFLKQMMCCMMPCEVCSK